MTLWFRLGRFFLWKKHESTDIIQFEKILHKRGDILEQIN